ncbi:MAG: undecaprenyl-diphosphate phosphatase [Defluviitaleaceae bacterium]|nr:undecaprenyl-diphosphate phosphatase [Defluviitaleaceae bacterium]
MTILEAIILGLLQGVTEFLPVSSSGHLLLLQRIFGIEEGLLTFSVVVHIATIIPVLFIYFDRIKPLLRNPFQKLTLLLILGTLPTVVAVLLFGDIIDTLFTGNFLAIGFIITGIILIITDKYKDGSKNVDEITGKDALLIGLTQAVAIMPGISRSGSTIFGAVVQGIDRKSAVNFSFLLSIPAIAGATVLEIRQLLIGQADINFFFTMPVIVGFFAAMISGYFAIKLMLKIVAASKLRYFAYYLIIVAVLIIIDQTFTNFVFG